MAEPKYPFLLLPAGAKSDKAKRSGGGVAVVVPGRARQGQRLQPQFDRLVEEIAERNMTLQAVVDGAAVEQVVVFEIAGSVDDFYRAVRKVGLNWLIDVEGESSEPNPDFHLKKEEAAPVPGKLFLILADQTAIDQILHLWHRYQENGRDAFGHGLAKWFHVFEQLRDVRLWSIEDRMEPETEDYFRSRLEAGDAQVRTEIELWYSDSPQKNADWAAKLAALLQQSGAPIVDRAEIGDVRYHAFLVDLPAAAVESILSDDASPLAVAGQVMYYRPQLRAMAPVAGAGSVAFPQARPIPEKPPVVAVMDGVPLQNHALLNQRIVVDDPANLQDLAQAQDRVHGTSMASIILHGDLNAGSPTIDSRLLIHPILIPDPHADQSPRDEVSPPDRLLLDVMHVAVKRLLEGAGGQPAVAPTVRVINLSIGDVKREFVRAMSPLARLIDWLSFKYRLLFVIPTGNLAALGNGLTLDVPRQEFAELSTEQRELAAFDAIENDKQFRRLLSPAESLNALTAGGLYADASTFQAPMGRFPMFSEAWPSPEGRLGPGFLRAIKPDLVAPGGRRLFQEKPGNVHALATLLPIQVGTAPGILSASPSAVAGDLNHTKYSAGTSNAAALVSHAAAHAHRAVSLLRENQAGETAIPETLDAVILKALTVHTSQWPGSDALKDALSTTNASEIKARMARLFGYGLLDIDRARGCSDERATLLGAGEIEADQGLSYKVPLPHSLAGKKTWRRITITLAWLSPINPQHRDYRRAIVWFKCDRSPLKVSPAGSDWRAMRRGTVQHDVWEGEKAAAYTDDAVLEVLVSCASDAGDLNEAVPFALCVSIEVASGVELPIYTEIAARVGVAIPVAVAGGQ